MTRQPLIAHIVFRFDVGGLENGLVNLVNRLPEHEFRHAIIALTEATDFRKRITRADVVVHAIGKRPGKDLAAYLRLYRLLRQLRPAVVHTRNYGTLDCQLVAFLARVPFCIHGEHGWDIHDPDGTNRKYQRVRRLLNPLIGRFVAVSRDLERWLLERVGIPARKVQRICNGVDTARFQPARDARARGGPREVVVGSVTRFEPIKDPLNLVRAFIAARRQLAVERDAVDLKLLMIGDGPLRAAALGELAAAGESNAASLPGGAADVAGHFGAMDCFALGSRREGISNTVLEAMASGLPVVASATGGNLELVLPGVTGVLVPPEDSASLAAALVEYANHRAMREQHGAAARARAEQEYSLEVMVNRYRDLYRLACGNAGVAG